MTDQTRTVAVVIGLLLVVSTLGTAVALESDTIELQAASSDSGSGTVTFTFTTSSNGTVSVPDQLSAASGNVVFTFVDWRRTDEPGSGTRNQWFADSNARYEVEYNIFVNSRTSEGVYDVDATVTQDGTTIASEILEANVDVLEPSFGTEPSPSPTVEVDAARPSEQSVEFGASIENDGDGLMSISGLRLVDGPSGISLSQWNVEDDEVPAFSSRRATIGLNVGPDVDEGTYRLTFEVSHTLGQTQRFTARVTVDELRPEFDDIPSQSITVTVNRVGEGGVNSDEVPVQNIGEGRLFLDDISFGDLPDGITTRALNLPGEIESGTTEQVPFEVFTENTVNDGTYTATGTVTDTLGNSVQFPLEVNIDVLFPEFGDVSRQQGNVEFDEPSENTKTVEFSPAFPNDGRGNMRVESLRFADVPPGFSINESSTPSQIVVPGDRLRGSFSVQVSDSVDEGTYEFTAVATDSLGNEERFPVEITVRKPPIVGFEEDPVDLGTVLVGSQTTTQVTLSELGGANGISQMTTNITSTPQNGSLDLSGVQSTSVPAGGRSDGSVTLQAAADAPQHERLTWTAEVTPETSDSETRTVTFSARVIYPPNLADVSGESASFTFDRAKPTQNYEQTTTLQFENTGDLSMTVTDVSATVDGTDEVTATVQDEPASVDGLSNASVGVLLSASPDANEGEYTVSISVETEEAGSKTITKTVTVNHEVELSVERQSVSFGELTITSEQSRTVDVAEQLGYQDVEDFTIELVSGPESYLEVTDRPPELFPAGSSDQFVFTLQFGTSATVYQEYEWTYRISGERIAAKNVTVTARPRPYSFENLRQNLSTVREGGEWREPLAGGVTQMLDTLEGRLRDNQSVGRNTLPTALSIARSALLFADAVEQAQQAQSNENYAEAQQHVVRASVARDQLVQFSRELQPSVRGPLDGTLQAANETLGGVVETQRTHYSDILDGDQPYDQRARAHRALARLYTITGERDAAVENRAATQNATAQYLDLVTNASEQRADADARWQAVRDNATVVVAGQPLVLNPARFDSVTGTLERIDVLYASAADQYQTAGAADEAQAVDDRRAQVATQATNLQYGLYGASGVYGLVVLALVVRVVFRSVQFARETKETTLGDFMLQSPDADDG